MADKKEHFSPYSSPDTGNLYEIKFPSFAFWTQKIQPLVYDDSLSYYEVLCRISNKLNECIEQVNNLTEAQKEFVESVTDTINKLIDDWNNMIDEFNEMVDTFNGWETTFETWTTTFNDWKTTFNNWTTTFNNWTTTFNNKITEINNALTELEEYKSELTNEWSEFQTTINNTISNFKTEVNNTINNFENTTNANIQELEEKVNTNTSNIATNTNNIATNTSNIATITTKLNSINWIDVTANCTAFYPEQDFINFAYISNNFLIFSGYSIWDYTDQMSEGLKSFYVLHGYIHINNMDNYGTPLSSSILGSCYVGTSSLTSIITDSTVNCSKNDGTISLHSGGYFGFNKYMLEEVTSDYSSVKVAYHLLIPIFN